MDILLPLFLNLFFIKKKEVNLIWISIFLILLFNFSWNSLMINCSMNINLTMLFLIGMVFFMGQMCIQNMSFMLEIISLSSYLFFLSLNFMILFFSFEISLIPILFIIFLWGIQPERISAFYFLLIYTIFSSFPLFFIIYNIFILLIFPFYNWDMKNLNFILLFQFSGLPFSLMFFLKIYIIFFISQFNMMITILMLFSSISILFNYFKITEFSLMKSLIIKNFFLNNVFLILFTPFIIINIFLFIFLLCFFNLKFFKFKFFLNYKNLKLKK